jgi:hypothetical protein
MTDDPIERLRLHVEKHKGKVLAPFSITGLQIVLDTLDAVAAQRDALEAQVKQMIAKEGKRIEKALVDRQRFDFLAHLHRQREWSGETFGPGTRTKGVIDHIRKELAEIEADPTDIAEWIDVVILALDGAWRAGHSPDQIVEALAAKQAKNEHRDWPDWRTMDEDRAIEHVR